MIALDLFAGTGWGVACQRLGIEEYGVEIMPEAVATRDAAGMATIYNDVWDGLDPEKWAYVAERIKNENTGRALNDWGAAGGTLAEFYELLIASPPCQTFSVAGKGTGRKALDDVLGALQAGAYKSAELLREYTAHLDDRTALVITPLSYAYRDRPMYVVLEQVPTVLPVWEACADILRELGYSAATAVLNAEQYGVPQTRKRAILVARRDGIDAAMPTPTHSRYYTNDPERLDVGVRKWVSMAEALGWGMTERPYPTIATGTGKGGTDPAALGGSGARRTVYAERARGAWLPSGDADNDGKILRLADTEAAILQSYPPFTAVKNMGRGMVERYGDRPGRPMDAPAFTIRASAGGTEPGGFVLRSEVADYPNIDGPAPTIACDPRLAPRGCKHPKPGCCSLNPDGAIRGRQFPPGTIKLTPAEAACFQSYPDGFPFQGGKGKRFEQIGNAVPPLLAEAVLHAAVAGHLTATKPAKAPARKERLVPPTLELDWEATA